MPWRDCGGNCKNLFCAIKYLSLTLVTQSISIICSFGSKDTRKIWNGERVKGLPPEIQSIARRKLRMLHASDNLNDLRIPPSNRLEKLSGNSMTFYSIRINDQWRIVFNWLDGMAEEVEIIDYH